MKLFHVGPNLFLVFIEVKDHAGLAIYSNKLLGDVASVALSWFLWLVLRHPHVEEWILAEIRSILNERAGNSMNFSLEVRVCVRGMYGSGLCYHLSQYFNHDAMAMENAPAGLISWKILVWIGSSPVANNFQRRLVEELKGTCYCYFLYSSMKP